ncbi:ribose transport system permease protein/AI-2 transport system permease protein/rhamnose transport system permease protein [Alicyclobacillus sacchari]|uniref:Autoinducer 2 import system permease protein LsrD n=2 Tax=Alicyclobacillus sacchari TaxID=392010 RepID=A0A4R8LHB3_9BACL|nr:ribose transport system permease protein/AI-2 transport system permease protein/rhamnose transport system permease protein [Alicyclobacillus sacchari]
MEMIVFSAVAPGFLNFENLMSSTNNFMAVGVMALSMTFVIITGGIDLSVGSMMSLCGVSMGLFWQHGLNIWIAAILALVLGALLGFINGQIIVRTGIQPLIATLATLFIYGSLAMVLAGQGDGSIYGFPQSYLFLGTGSLFRIMPVQLLVFSFLALVFGFVLQRTNYGRRVYFIGNNEAAALYSGVRVQHVKTYTYVISGCMSGVAAVLMGSYFASVRGDMGLNYELTVITACLVGGVNVFGGSGTIFGVVVGAFILGMLQQGLNMLNVSSVEQSIVTGLILIAAVGIQQMSGLFSRRTRRIKKDRMSDLGLVSTGRE